MPSHSMKTCSFPGCEKQHHSKDLCSSHRQQQYRGRPLTSLRVRVPLGKRYRKIQCPNHGLVKGLCWEWLFSKTWGGYGQLYYDGRYYLAHRLMWERANGPIPKGLVVDHICRNRACCNPAHLRIVTRQVNVTENVVGARWQKLKARTHCKHGHEFTPENTSYAKDGRRCRAYSRACKKIRRNRNTKEIA